MLKFGVLETDSNGSYLLKVIKLLKWFGLSS
jgi:hypothetical protein